MSDSGEEKRNDDTAAVSEEAEPVKRKGRTAKTENKVPENHEEKSPNRTQIYMGPKLPGGILQHGAVFTGGLPPGLEASISAYPELKRFLVDVEELPELHRQMQCRSSETTRLYRRVSEKIRRDGEKR